MAILKPEINDFEAAISRALEQANSETPITTEVPLGAAKEDKKSAFVQALDSGGASLETAARRIASVCNFPESEANGLRAAELILKANGLMKELDKDVRQVPEVHITIVGQGNQSVINLLMPK